MLLLVGVWIIRVVAVVVVVLGVPDELEEG
jgi:hypothetical protein